MRFFELRSGRWCLGQASEYQYTAVCSSKRRYNKTKRDTTKQNLLLRKRQQQRESNSINKTLCTKHRDNSFKKPECQTYLKERKTEDVQKLKEKDKTVTEGRKDVQISKNE